LRQFRTFYPMLSLHSPVEFSEIVNTYLDGYRKRGWMPECRANNVPGWTQVPFVLLDTNYWKGR
jgi:putative alpha-1,2-mannosidase